MVNAQLDQQKPVVLLLIALAAILAGALIGASTNAINGAVSPAYFRNMMRWDDVEDTWRAAVAQGVFEGLIYGVFFSAIITMVVGIVTRVRCSLSFALRHLSLIVIAIFCCWGTGGLAAMGLALLSPEFYRHAFIGVPEATGPMLRFAWVGGSIWGAMFGGLLAITIGSVLFAASWRHSQSHAAG